MILIKRIFHYWYDVPFILLGGYCLSQLALMVYSLMPGGIGYDRPFWFIYSLSVFCTYLVGVRVRYIVNDGKDDVFDRRLVYIMIVIGLLALICEVLGF